MKDRKEAVIFTRNQSSGARKALSRFGAALPAALALLAITGSNALAGGSGLQIEASMTPWWTFLTTTVPWWAGTVAIVVGAIILCFAGMQEGGSRLVSAFAGTVIAVGVVTWVMASLGAGQAGLLALA